MAVFQVKKYKTIKDENGNKIQVPKTKEEWNKDTKNGTATWYFVDRYDLNGKRLQFKSSLFVFKREAEEHNRLFLNDPIGYILKYSKKAKKKIKNTQVENDCTLSYYFKEFLAYYTKYVSEGTIYCYQSKYNVHLKDLIGNLLPTDINFDKTMEIHEIIDRKKISSGTKNTIHSTLVTFFDYLKKLGKIKENYAKNYGSYKIEKNEDDEIKIRYQTLEEFNLFISVVDDEFWNLVFTFAFWHGNRKGEQRALYCEDIDFKNDQVDYNKTFTRDKNGSDVIKNTTKNGKTGKTYLAECCKGKLQKHIQFMKSLPGYNKKCFLFGGQFPISRNMIDRKLKYYYKKLKEKYPDKEIIELTFHEFARHSHATYLYEIGRNEPDIIRIIADRIRDSEDVVRKWYVHKDTSKSNDKIKKLLN